MLTFPFTVYKDRLWTPADMETVVWCDAADLASITHTGGTVTTWADKSGNGWDLIAGGSPQTGVNKQNGLNRIDLTNDYFATGSVLDTFPGDIAIFQVCQMDAQTFAAGDSVFSLNATPNVDFQFDDISASTDFDGRIRATGIPSNNTDLTTGPLQGSTRIFETIFDLNNLGVFNAYITGEKATPDTTYTIGMGSTSANLIVFNNRTQARLINGFVCEVVVIENVTVSQRQCMEGYLAWKWGFPEDLPSNHPYKFAAPTECLTDPVDLNPEFFYSPDSLVVGSRDAWSNSGSESSSELVVLNGSTGTPAFVDVVADSVIGYNVFRINASLSENLFEMQSSSITPQANYAIFMVVKMDAAANDEDDFFFATDGVYAFDDIIHWVYANGTRSKVDLFGTNNQFTSSTQLTDDTWHVIGFHQESLTSVTVYVDDDDAKTHAIPTAISAKRFDNFEICGWSDGTSYQKWCQCDIAELVMICHAITPAEALSVQQFLTTKYNTPIASP